MSLRRHLKQVGRWIGFGGRSHALSLPRNRFRSVILETMEPRLAMTADPIWVGGVYVEEDVGTDAHGDRFVVTFKGGAPGTTLDRLIIDGNVNGPEFGLGDLFFDIFESGLGADHAFGFQIEQLITADPTATVRASVTEGPTGLPLDVNQLITQSRLTLDFTNFKAGDLLVFSIDVDEAQAFNPQATDIEEINSGFDPITSGVEFQGSLFHASFSAPHYENAEGQSRYLNRYDPVVEPSGLDLPEDNHEGKRDRSAGTAVRIQQTPKPVSLAGIVYVDNNLDLTLQPTEQRLAGVRLELFKKEGSGFVTTGHTTQTDAQGRYLFDSNLGLMPGIYQVRQTQPSGYFSVGATPGFLNITTRVGQTVNGNPDWLTEIEIPLGDQHATELNFAEAQPALISGYVYADSDNDGVRDPNEVGLPDVEVRLQATSSLAPQTTLVVRTDARGFYQFTNLVPGVYTITEVAQPSGYLDGKDTAGRVGSQSRGTASNETITAIRLDGAESGVEYNFGEILPGSIAGRVFSDTDGDCLLDAPRDQPLAGVKIELLDDNGTVIRLTLTDSEGRYRFDDLIPGRYTVRETQPAGYFHGGQIAGSGGGDASQADLIRAISLAAGNTLVNYDFCEIPPAEISGVVFVDRDSDCIYDAGEIHLQGVVITLIDQNGNVVGQTTTDANGRYQFTNLRPGNYSIREEQPTGYLQGGQRAGSAGGDDSVADLISSIPIGAGETLVDYDFCEIEPAEISGLVFSDRDEDCVYDPGESAISGVLISLLDESGNIVEQTLTDAAGKYRFTNLRPGNYSIHEAQPEGYFQGGQKAGSGGGDASVADRISRIPIGPGETLVDYDFCELEPGELSGYVFVDRNGDCFFDSDEQPIAGVIITLLDQNGVVVAQTQTDVNGAYHFGSLVPGNYAVAEQQPGGYLQGGQRAGSGGGDATRQDEISAIRLGPGVSLVDYNFCEITPATLGGQVFVDRDFDCLRDEDEAPLAGVRVDLLDENGQILATTLTDADGRYRFDNLPPGNYTVYEHQPEGYFHGGQVAPAGNGDDTLDDIISAIALGSGAVIDDANFCEVPPATISGYVFQDGPVITTEDGTVPADLASIRDGLRTGDDQPIHNVRVQLRSVNGLPLESTRALPGYYSGPYIELVTDASGYYEFRGLRPGAYHIYQSQPEGYFDALDTPGTTGGFSINRGQTETSPQFEILMLALTADAETNPGFDAILLVSLDAGQHSRENNFSEVVTQSNPQAPPPRDPPRDSPKGIVNPETFTTLPPIHVTPSTWYPLPLLIGFSDQTPPTWHLSIINAGYPRGRRAGQPVRESDIARSSQFLNVRSWTVRGMQQSTWRIVSTLPKVNHVANRSVFDIPDATPLAGDFNGDGFDEMALFIDGEWFVDLNGNGTWDDEDIWLKLGDRGDQPVVGDWDNDGKDDVGIFGRKWSGDDRALAAEAGLPDPENRRRVKPKNLPPTGDEAPERPRLLQRSNQGPARADLIDHVFRFGAKKDIAVAGDFNGDGISSVGVFKEGKWTLDVDGDGRFAPSQDLQIEFGEAGDLPLVGDFDGDGIDDLAILRGNRVLVDANRNGRLDATDQVFEVESGEGTVIVGDFNGDGKDEPALHQANPQHRTLEARRAG